MSLLRPTRLAFSLSVTVLLAACQSTQHKIPTIQTDNGKRIYIPQEQVQYVPQLQPKAMPEQFRTWLNERHHASDTRSYEQYLIRQQGTNYVPMFELLRSARDWQRCGRSPYALPSRELWNNIVPTLKIINELVEQKILSDFEVTSVYRDLPLNQCAGGASSSRHLFNSAIDFRVGSATPNHQEQMYIDMTKAKICSYWRQHGQRQNMGVGVYSSGQIHIDTQGFRTWGPDLSRYSSPCYDFSEL